MINNENCNNIRSLILKSITGELLDSEKSMLDSWINETDENRLFYEELVSDDHLFQEIEKLKAEDYQSALNRFLEIKRKKERKKIVPYFLTFGKYAAVISITILISYFWLSSHQQERLVVLDNYNLKLATPQLKLYNGTTVNLACSTIDDDLNKNGVAGVIANSTKLLYPIQVENDELKYNLLTVPQKMKYCILLSDGTKAWVNSESALRHPIAFGKNERKVYVSGKVLFDVAKDKNRPFIVVAQGVNVQVMGTVFDIESYPQDENVKVTLSEGSVKAYNNKLDCILVPNQQLVFNKKNKTHTIKSVNAENVKSWATGMIIFDEASLAEIADVIKRTYGIYCEIITDKYEGVRITGVLDTTKDLHYFMNQLNQSSKIDYILQDDCLLIK